MEEIEVSQGVILYKCTLSCLVLETRKPAARFSPPPRHSPIRKSMQIGILTNAEASDLPSACLHTLNAPEYSEYISNTFAESVTRCAFHSDNLLTFFSFSDARHRPGGGGKGQLCGSLPFKCVMMQWVSCRLSGLHSHKHTHTHTQTDKRLIKLFIRFEVKFNCS